MAMWTTLSVDRGVNRGSARWMCSMFAVALLVTVAGAQQCGQRKVNTVFLIHNGREAKEGFWPWHSAIFQRTGGTFAYSCGGSILDPTTILTAAHCLLSGNLPIAAERLSVQVGRNRLSVGDGRSKEHQADRFLIHPDYENIENDIGLIKLVTTIEWTPYVQPICLWEQAGDQDAIVGHRGFVVGFGLNEEDKISDYLREADLPVVDTITCIKSNRVAFGYTLTEKMFCAGERNGVAACNGDSGGGMFFEHNNRWYVRGLVSFTPKRGNSNFCDPKEYTVFTDVVSYIPWIKEHMRPSTATMNTDIANVDQNPKLRLLNMNICGMNAYEDIPESSKPIFLTYPWVGLLEYSVEGSSQKMFFCHATLINERYLLTASSCVYNLPQKYRLTSVRLGEYDLTKANDCDQLDGQRVCSPSTQTIRIESAIVHKSFNTPRFANDIALLRLREPADISRDNIKPICLPVTNTLRSYKPNTFIQTGWPTGSSASTMERSEPTNLNSVECQQQYTDRDIPLQKTYHQICVNRQTDASSGGCRFPISAVPLQVVQQVQGYDRYVLHGLLSYGPKKCSASFPDVYTNVGTYMDWILNSMQE